MQYKELKRYMKECIGYGIEPSLTNLIKNLRAKDNTKYAIKYLIKGE